jgi:hypothetical protein
MSTFVNPVCLFDPKGKDSLSTINEISLHRYHCVLKSGPFSNIYLWIYLDKQHYFQYVARSENTGSSAEN